jgi:hypothetical protein
MFEAPVHVRRCARGGEARAGAVRAKDRRATVTDAGVVTFWIDQDTDDRFLDRRLRAIPMGARWAND